MATRRGVRAIPEAAVAIIRKYERPRDGDPRTPNLDPYLDPAGIATIGWGHAIVGPEGNQTRSLAVAKKLFPNGLTKTQAEDLFRADLLIYGAGVEAALPTVTLSESEFGALVSFAFNIGLAAFAGSRTRPASSLCSLLRRGLRTEARGEFGKWVKARDKTGRLVVLPGLVARRADEAELFMPYSTYVKRVGEKER
jgi:lysozyme